MFCSEYGPKTKEHVGLPTGDVAKKPGGQWNGMAADDKQAALGREGCPA